MQGVTFGNIHSFRDWGLGWVNFTIQAPEVKTHYLEVPGRDGPIDATEVLTGRPVYGQRTLTFTFDTRSSLFDDWQRAYSAAMNALHGKKMRVILDTDPDFYYLGRIAVSSQKKERETDTLTITVTAYPYKLEITSGSEPWIWDTFNFETGIVREYSSLPVEGALTVSIIGREMPVIPVFDCSAAMTVEYNGETFQLAAGRNKNPDIFLGAGENTLIFRGSGTVSIDYRGGEM